jgi:hypothetical protein
MALGETRRDGLGNPEYLKRGWRGRLRISSSSAPRYLDTLRWTTRRHSLR